MNQLNKEQQEAVDTLKGPLVIIAGAGSGKTATVISRISNLVSHGVRPNNILAITFTNKAAAEMKERLPLNAAGVHASTIHSLCVSILRQFAKDSLGAPLNFTIMDTDDQKRIYSQIFDDICDEMEQSGDPIFEPGIQVNKNKYVRIIMGNISGCKNENISPERYLYDPYTAKHVMREITQIVYERYTNECKRMNAFDFDDLLIRSYNLLLTNNTALNILQNQYTYITVDEYQDTNTIQNQLVNLIAAKNQNLCVVGDPDQSIYGWRGAHVTNILNFQATYPNAKLINLNRNYRSAQSILDTANDIINNNNLAQFNRKPLISDKNSTHKPMVYTFLTEVDEAAYVAKAIKKYHNDGVEFKDMVILYRTHALNRAMEHALQEHQIPYKISGGLSFYDRAEIKDIIAYLNVLANFSYDPSLKRIINVPSRGLGTKTIQALQDWSDNQAIRKPLLMALENVDQVKDIPTSKKETIHAFLDVYHNALRKNSTMVELVTYFITEFDYKNHLTNSENHEEKLNNLDEFLTDAALFDAANPPQSKDEWLEVFSEENVESAMVNDLLNRLIEFLNNVATDKEANARDAAKALEGNESNYVTLMTVHAAKGLEFDEVFIIGLEEGIFPSAQSIKSLSKNKHAIDEERRLMYVAVTRAKKLLTMTNVKKRMLYGNFQNSPESRFLKEIEPGHVIKKTIEASIGRSTQPANKPKNPWT